MSDFTIRQCAGCGSIKNVTTDKDDEFCVPYCAECRKEGEEFLKQIKL